MRVQWFAGQGEVRLAECLVLRRMSMHQRGDVLRVGLPVDDQLGLPDQFALAVVVYEWLTGRRPFVGDSLEEIARSQRQPPTPLKFALPGLPEAVSQAVSRALSFNPQDRFPSCRDFVHQVMASMGLATPPSKPASGRR